MAFRTGFKTVMLNLVQHPPGGSGMNPWNEAKKIGTVLMTK
jgi:hypothetical protein